jgi:dUTP pyrophosphatase
MINIKFKKICNNFELPKVATIGSACFDLVYPYGNNWNLEKGEYQKIPLGFSVEIPVGYVMLMFPRSGLSFKEGISLTNCVGVIDSDYRGEVCALVIKNISWFMPTMIKKGDRICQAMLLELPNVNLELSEELTDTQRGDGGFGSTGN